MVARGRNSTSDNQCAINRSIGVQRHGVNQFLASRNIHGTFKQTGWRFRQGNFVIALSVRWMCLAVSECWPADHLDAFDHALRANSTRLLIVLTLPPRYRCPLDRLPAPRLMPPRSGLERSDFVHWRLSAAGRLISARG